MSLSGLVTNPSSGPPYQIRWQVDGFSTATSYKVTTSDGHSTTWSDGTNFDWTNGHGSGVTVTGTAQALVGGSWVSAGSASVSTPSPPPPNNMGPITVVVDGNDVTWSWSNPGGASWYQLSGVYSSAVYSGTSLTITGLAPGTYTLTVTPVNNYGSGASASGTARTRPYNYSWSSPVVSGFDFIFYATDFEAFRTRINDFRYYKGLSNWSWLYSVYSGQTFLAAMYNETLSAMIACDPNWWYASNKNSGDDVTAQALNELIWTMETIL